MQSLSVVAPVLTPIAIKIIEKYLLDDKPRRSKPKIIQVPAPPQYICCCGEIITDKSGNARGTCDTCSEGSSSCRSSNNKLLLTTEGKTRSSSTGSSHESKSYRSQRTRTHSASDTMPARGGREYNGNDTLVHLASKLRQEILSNNGRGADESQRRHASASDLSPKMVKVNATSPMTGSRTCNRDQNLTSRCKYNNNKCGSTMSRCSSRAGR